jgi:hypothetical protein
MFNTSSQIAAQITKKRNKYFYAATRCSIFTALWMRLLSEIAFKNHFTEKIATFTNKICSLNRNRSFRAVIRTTFEKVFHRIWLKFVGGNLTAYFYVKKGREQRLLLPPLFIFNA